MARHIVLAITGATGAGFGVAVLERLVASEQIGRISLLASATGRRCLFDETGLRAEDLGSRSKVQLLNERDLGSGISSGSHPHDGMVIVPCSAGTLGRIASGTSDNLICRAADVCLKERRPLVLCLRETPLNRIHLENQLRVHDAGACIMPLMPAFYTKPQGIQDLFDAFATRVLDQIGIVEADGRRWKG